MLREYLGGELKLSTRTLSRLKHNEKGILLNGQRVTVRAVLQCGDTLSLALEDGDGDTNPDIVPSEIPLDILYEDEDTVAVNKPSGMATHPSYNHRTDTLANALVYYFEKQNRPFVFRAVNRLDIEASGIVLAAKSKNAAYRYNTAMRRGLIEKSYTAILRGTLPEQSGRLESYISRLREGVVIRCSRESGADSEYALTEYSVSETAGGFTLVSAVPVTGRTHQLRVHFSSAGCPILGDTMYGGESPYIPRTALHSSKISFDRLSDGKRISLSSELPEDMKKVWEMIRCQTASAQK